MDLSSIAKTLMWHKESDDDHSGGGIFLTLPDSLAKKYPKDGRAGEDESPPHITVLYVDEVKKHQKKKGEYLQAIEDVCKKLKRFKLKIGPTRSLVNADNQKVYYSSFNSSPLRGLNEKLKKEFDKKKLTYSKKYKSFKPHVTIEYVNEGEESKYKDKTIGGEFEVNYLWLWGFGEPSVVFLGG